MGPGLTNRVGKCRTIDLKNLYQTVHPVIVVRKGKLRAKFYQP